MLFSYAQVFWCLGTIFGLIFSRRSAGYLPGVSLFVSGVGGFLALYLGVLSFFLINVVGVDPLIAITPAVGSYLMFVSALVRGLRSSSHVFREIHYSREAVNFSRGELGFLLPLVAIVLAQLIASSYFAINLPLFGWDVLDHWAAVASQAISLYEQHGLTSFENTGPHRRHPPAIPFLLAWDGVSRTGICDDCGGGGVPWFLLSMTCTLIATGLCLYIGKGLLIAVLSACITLSLPLAGNHVAIAGYTEFVIASALLAAVSILGVGVISQNFLLLFLGLVLAVTTITLKNIGLMYFLVLMTSVGVMFVRNHMTSKGQRPNRAPLVVMCIIAICFLLSFLLENGTSFDPANGVAFFGGKELVFKWPGLGALVENHLHSLIFNSSFSMFFLSLFFIAFALLPAGNSGPSQLSMFMLVVVVCGVTVLAASQLTSHGYNFAVPGRDTGNSRFTLPFVYLIGILFPVVLDDVLSRR